MLSASESPCGQPRRRSPIHVWLALTLLAACSLKPEAAPATVPATAASPSNMTTPTIEIRSSDDLYAGDQRSIGETSGSLASFPAGAILPPAPSGDSENSVTVLLAANDWIQGQLHQADGERQPGLLLLGNALDAWGSLPARLAQSGFTTLVLQVDGDTQARQLEIMLRSLIALPRLDAGSVAVLGEGEAAALALLGCAVNSLCDALALFNPPAGATMLNALAAYGKRPLWLAAVSDNTRAHEEAAALAEAALGNSHLAVARTEAARAGELISWLHNHLRAEP